MTRKNKEAAKEKDDKKKSKAAVAPVEPADNSSSSEGEDDVDEYFEDEGGIRVGDIYIPPAPPAACTVESTGPRLVITKIVAENFKSYFGKQSLGPFHQSFTSIIGPNGSGKSNVIDSMLFVFGYRASKIRTKRIGVLVHSSKGHSANSCYVSVHFAMVVDKPDGDCETVPNSEFVITRTAYVDNSSFYSLNGKRVQFKEVALRLRENGIDLVHNRFLILQGEVEQISMMKPKSPNEHETGMLEYLEDIVGTSRYKEPIEKLAVKVEELNQERLEKVTRVKLAEKERDAMEGPMKEAVDFLKAENELMHSKNKLFQKEINVAKKQMTMKEEEKKVIDDGMAKMKEELKKYQEERADAEKEVDQLKSQLNKMMNQKEKLDDEFKMKTNKDTTLAEEIMQTNAKRKKMQEQKKQEEHKLNEYKNLPEKNEKEIAELEKLKVKLEAEKTKVDAEVSKVLVSLREETVGLQDEKDKHESELSGLKKFVTDAKTKYDLAQSELDLYLKKEQTEKSRLEQMKKSLENSTSIRNKRREEVAELEGKLPASRAELEAGERELGELRGREKVLSQQIQRERVLFEETRCAAQASRSNNRVLDYLMQRKQAGQLPGLFGRLGDLGGIDSKYDCAVSTACGALDNVVCDTADTAKVCIAALKADNVGRATFIALDKQQHLRNTYAKPFNAPEQVPRLFDVIKVVDDRVRPAFYYALRNTLVADNLDQASRIAYGAIRHRVVTLEGEIIEPSGTMAGGGNRKLRGKMGRSVATVTGGRGGGGEMSAAEMQQKEEQLQRQEEELREMRMRIATLERTVLQLRTNIDQWQKHVKKFATELQSLEAQVPDLEKQLEAQEMKVKAVEPDKVKVKSMNKTIDQCKKELNDAEAKASVVEAKVVNLHQKIMDASGGRMKAAQKKLDDVTKKLDKMCTEISKLTVGIKTAARNSKKATEKIENLKAEIGEAEKKLIAYDAEKTVLFEEGQKIMKMIESISEGIAEKEVLKKDLAKRMGNISKEENQLKANKLVEDQKLDSINAEIKKHRDLIPGYERRLSKLKLHKIPNETEPEVLEVFTDEQLEEVNAERLSYKVQSIEDNLTKKKPNLSVIDEYYKKVEVHEARSRELDEVTARRNECRQWHDNARKARLREFMAGFVIISNKLKEMYQMITLGGDAELELLDSLDPFTEGIVFSVRPPKKSWKHISNLSGGEKTLSSLALVFALHYYKPTPLYVMDEIDAALDFKNVSIVGHYVKERTKNAQFIIISLRANMFELADRLVGIYKTDNCTSSVTINPGIYCQPPYATDKPDDDDRPDRRKPLDFDKKKVAIDMKKSSDPDKQKPDQQKPDQQKPGQQKPPCSGDPQPSCSSEPKPGCSGRQAGKQKTASSIEQMQSSDEDEDCVTGKSANVEASPVAEPSQSPQPTTSLESSLSSDISSDISPTASSTSKTTRRKSSRKASEETNEVDEEFGELPKKMKKRSRN
ncbi:structural maintenance of chromosomes protein 4 [Nilaparvata lugens]|uniref:structural maintenance of chromosomes protein 4 n=1 Tax=Nilaparvata lugens TaxID=108931 RepID=UPI00193E32C9|nr:structural maintenance of chromosomes protein 4 [Nilaparvata lugens]XP_039277023.1 structural maintenance of chromosomes protein 4 [Nilaparvata lugens]